MGIPRGAPSAAPNAGPGCRLCLLASPGCSCWPATPDLALCPQVFEILLSRGYSENNFREDLKNLYLKLGVENKTMIFLFTDAHVAEEGFLELINNMLTSGRAEVEAKAVLQTGVPAVPWPGPSAAALRVFMFAHETLAAVPG